MEKFIAIAKIIAYLLPHLVEFIKTVENALPASGQGASKLALVRSMVEGLFDFTQQLTVTFDEAWPAINKVITATVTAFNASGVFKK